MEPTGSTLGQRGTNEFCYRGAKGPPANCRPVILLSTLRKILTIIMIRRTMKMMQEKIPLTQAAYLPGRGTTEQVFAIKLMTEKAISTANYEINVLLLDMSKAFDTIEHDTLINDLKQVLEPDELHIFYLLLKDVEIRVSVKKNNWKILHHKYGITSGRLIQRIPLHFLSSRWAIGGRWLQSPASQDGDGGKPGFGEGQFWQCHRTRIVAIFGMRVGIGY